MSCVTPRTSSLPSACLRAEVMTVAGGRSSTGVSSCGNETGADFAARTSLPVNFSTLAKPALPAAGNFVLTTFVTSPAAG